MSLRESHPKVNLNTKIDNDKKMTDKIFNTTAHPYNPWSGGQKTRLSLCDFLLLMDVNE
jgi:galactose mutarotase-like enzyme